jgi:hypothetical protein
MGIPACLWRRTGEIFKGNTEFAKLIGVDPADLLDVRSNFYTVQDWFMIHLQGRLTIYEMMSEDSAVNFFEVGHNASIPSDLLCLMLVVVVSRNTDRSPSTLAKRLYSPLACLNINPSRTWDKIRSTSTAAFRSLFVGTPGAFRLLLLATSSHSDTPYE